MSNTNGPAFVPEELLEGIQRGKVLFFIGDGISRPLLPSYTELAEELALRCAYPKDGPRTLAHVAGYYARVNGGPNGVIQFIRDRLEVANFGSTRAHQLIARIRPRIIVSACYDRLMEYALREAGVPHNAFVTNADVPYADEQHVWLVWLWGTYDQPESLIITDDERRRFAEGRGSFSGFLRSELAQRTWLFLGCDAADESIQGLFDSLGRDIEQHRQRSYIVDMALSGFSRAWWEQHSAHVLDVGVEPFLEAVVERLSARARAGREATVQQPNYAQALPEYPYKFLYYYEAEDAAIFCGRMKETRDLVSHVHANRLVLLYGASGVGKTSLLKAGMAPRLEAADPPYMVLYIRPRQHPANAILSAIRQRLTELNLLFDETSSLIETIKLSTRLTSRSLVIVMDQFEEFFVELDKRLQEDFIITLRTIYDSTDARIKFVFSLRQDWLWAMQIWEKSIAEFANIRTMYLAPLDRDQAYQAITTPVKHLGYYYEKTFAEQLLNDLTDSTGLNVLPPQLQLVCSALFDSLEADEREINMAVYERLGRARGVLRLYLERALSRMGKDERLLAMRVLQEFVTSQDTKIAKQLEDLALALPEVDTPVLAASLESLVKRRLLRVLETADGDIGYELAHEYLISELKLTDQIKRRKQAEELLRQQFEIWRRVTDLPGSGLFELIDEQRDELRLSPEQAAFMLRAAIHHNSSVSSWIARVSPQQAIGAITDMAGAWRDKHQDSLNAIDALEHLPAEACGPWLYDLLCDAPLNANLSRKILTVLREKRPADVEEYLEAVLLGDDQSKRFTAIKLMAELGTEKAVKVLGKVFDQLPDEARLEVINSIGVLEFGDTHSLFIIRAAVYDPAYSVREVAQTFARKLTGEATMQALFMICIPNFEYEYYMQNLIKVGGQYVFRRRLSSRLWRFFLNFVRDLNQYGEMAHVRAINLAGELSSGNVEALVKILDHELRAQPSVRDSLSRFLFALPALLLLLEAALVPVTALFAPALFDRNLFIGMALAVGVLFPVAYSAYALSYRSLARTSSDDLANHFKGMERDFQHNYYLAQSALLRSSVFFAALLLLSLLIPNLFFYLILGLGALALVVLLWLVISMQAGFGLYAVTGNATIRWCTALNVLKGLQQDRIYTVIKGGPLQSDYVPSPEMLKRLKTFARTIEHKQHFIRALSLLQDESFAEGLADPDRGQPSGQQRSWQEHTYPASIVRHLEAEIWWFELRQQVYGAFVQFRRIAIRLAIGVAVSLVILLFLESMTAQNTLKEWEATLTPGDAAEVWLKHENLLYRAELDRTGRYALQHQVSVDAPLERVACGADSKICLIVSQERRIGLVREGAVTWLNLPYMPLPIQSTWVSRGDDGTTRLWLQAEAKLLAARVLPAGDQGDDWTTPKDLEGLQVAAMAGTDERNATAVVNSAPDGRELVYVTADGGATWRQASRKPGYYFWTEYRLGGSEGLQAARLFGPDRLGNTETVNVYQLDIPSMDKVLLAFGSSKGNIWLSEDGSISWKQVMDMRDSRGSAECNASFSNLNVAVRSNRALIYRSYALRDGELGVDYSLDLGRSWHRLPVSHGLPKEVLPLWRWILRFGPLCGGGW